MGWTIALLLFGLWILGMVSGATLGGWVHLLLVFSLLALLLSLLRGARARGAA